MSAEYRRHADNRLARAADQRRKFDTFLREVMETKAIQDLRKRAMIEIALTGECTIDPGIAVELALSEVARK